MIQTTRWSPDTCDCIVEYWWDDAVSIDSRIHTLSNYVKTCNAHLNQADDYARFDIINEENPRKNISYQMVIDNAPAAFVDITADGSKSLKTGLSLNVSVSGVAPNRIFTLTLIGTTLTTTQKNAIQNALNNRFGTGKVIFAWK